MMTFKLQHNDWMSVNNRNKLGPEYGIGHSLGNAIEAPMMILKSCIGNRSLGWDLLPPGSEPYEFEGKMVPGYRGTPENPKGNVATVYSNPFCHGGSGNSHYGGNGETYMDVGEAMGRAMVELLTQ